MNLTGIYRKFHPTTMQNTFFSGAHEMFSKIDYTLGHKTSLNKFLKIEMSPSLISDHNRIKLEFNSKRNCRNIQAHRN
jgi:hypothetical protein